MPISAFNVRKSPEFAHPTGNQGQGTQWWRLISDEK